jgi:hypothetical protein
MPWSSGFSRVEETGSATVLTINLADLEPV